MLQTFQMNVGSLDKPLWDSDASLGITSQGQFIQRDNVLQTAPDFDRLIWARFTRLSRMFKALILSALPVSVVLQRWGAAITKYHALCGLKQEFIFSDVEAGKSKVKVLVSAEPSGLVDVCSCMPCSHTEKKERAWALSQMVLLDA